MGDWTFWLAIGVALLIAYAVMLWLGLVVWTYFDMKDRSHDPLARWVATAAVLFFMIPGFFLYLIFRPHETLSEAYERRLEAEALKGELVEQRRSCPTCRRPSRDDFLICPHCRTVLQEPCVHCQRPLDLSWLVCPYCGTSGPRSTTTTPATPTQRVTERVEPPPSVEPPPLVEPAGVSPRAAASRTRPRPSTARRATGPEAASPATEAGASTPSGPAA